MRVALVILHAELRRGGAERYAITLADKLVERGHDVTLLAASFEQAGRARQVRLDRFGLTRKARYLRFIDGLDARIDKSRYDIVHAFLPVPRCHVYHAQAGVEGLSWAADRSLLRNSNTRRKAFVQVEHKLLTSAAGPVVICLSAREQRNTIQAFGISPNRVLAMHNAVDEARFSLDDLQRRRAAMRRDLGLKDETAFLFVGNDFARKGLDTAILAIGRMTRTRGVLLVVGNDNIRRWTDLVARQRLVGRVLFVGQSDRVSEYLAAADVLVLPSRSEPFGMVVIEAMLMGVPPIVSRAAGASEEIDVGVDGLVVESADDSHAWAHAMDNLADDALRARLSQACLARRPLMTFAAHLDAIESVYARARS